MKAAEAFWDSSVLIPLCVNQGISRRCHELYRQFSTTVWWGTPVEIKSALMRLLRSGAISNADCFQARSVADQLAQDWDVVQPTAKITADAKSLLALYPLRAADALQLAAALTWCEGQTSGQLFLTGDQRLAEAAKQAGFTVDLVLP